MLDSFLAASLTTFFASSYYLCRALRSRFRFLFLDSRSCGSWASAEDWLSTAWSVLSLTFFRWLAGGARCGCPWPCGEDFVPGSVASSCFLKSDMVLGSTNFFICGLGAA